MKIFLLLFLCFFVFFSFADGNKCNVFNASLESDSVIKQIFKSYQSALILNDKSFPQKWFISDQEYVQILEYVKQKQPNCIGNDETTFTTETNNKVFSDLISAKIKVTHVYVNRIEYNYSCGNLLEIPRAICEIEYANKKTVEVPFLLIKTLDNQYKILRNFLNTKLFTNE